MERISSLNIDSQLFNGESINQITKSSEVDLEILVTLLVHMYHPEKIICFGKRITEQLHSGCFLSPVSGCTAHYFLLMETGTDLIQEEEIQEFIRSNFTVGKITLLVHGRGTVDYAIRKQNRFFNNVYRDGELLFCRRGDRELVRYVQLNPQKVYEKAVQRLEPTCSIALAFWQMVGISMEKGHHKVAVFLMHQTMEQACIALIRLYIGYRYDTNSILHLLDLCGCFMEDPNVLFPRGTANEIRLFSLLDRSYSDSRYKDGFKIQEADALQLYRLVDDFMEKVKHLYSSKLNSLQKAASKAVDKKGSEVSHV